MAISFFRLVLFSCFVKKMCPPVLSIGKFRFLTFKFSFNEFFRTIWSNSPTSVCDVLTAFLDGSWRLEPLLQEKGDPEKQGDDAQIKLRAKGKEKYEKRKLTLSFYCARPFLS